MLFTDINDLKTHIGGTYTASVKLASIAPFFEDAVNHQILPRLGAETVDILRGSNLHGKTLVASGLMKSAVAWFGVYEYAQIGNVAFTENGLQRFENESYKSAFKYQETGFRNTAIVKAWSNFELLLQILFENPTDFPEYANSPEAALNMSHFLNFTNDFRWARCTVPDRFTLESLLPYISDIETFMVAPFLGETLNNLLLSKLYVNDEPNPAKKQTQLALIRLLQQGIAQFAYHLATVGNVIEFRGNRVLVRETSRDDDYDNTKPPAFDLISANFNQKRDWANRYFQRAEGFIRDNQAVFGDWQGFLPPTPEGSEGFETVFENAHKRLKSL
jgi:hypothetical protein